MRTAFLTFFAIALLGLHQPAYARRGGGGGGGGSSSGSGSSSGGSRTSKDRSGSQCYDPTSSIGNASDPFDPMYTNQWLYKFVGSYYNGSVVSIPTFFISLLGRHWVLTMGYHY